MLKIVVKPLLAIVCVLFFACSNPSTSAVTTSDKGQEIKSEPPQPSESLSVNAKSFVDSFIDTQKCVIKEISTRGSADASKKPSAEDLAKITNTLDEKSQNSQISDSAWGDLTKGCNNAEINSLHSFFQCQQAACDDPNPSSANEKHRACALPVTGDGCKTSFGQFMSRFSPF
jgi:hypothetical protein